MRPATNPGSFEPPENDSGWTRTPNGVFATDDVVIGADRPAAKLTVDGDIYTSGRVVCPSDIRLKEDITDKETCVALANLCKLRVVDYLYKPEVAAKWGLTEEQRKRTGVIAQELATVIPDAVRDLGDYLTVNESRVFYETVLATQELCRLTGDLDQKINEKVAEIGRRLTRYARQKKIGSSISSDLYTVTSDDWTEDSRSLMTLSRNTLNTETPVENKRRFRRVKKKCTPQGITTERKSWGSSMTQSTIVTLVGIMAICLIAMCTLYVLDWHNRNYGSDKGSASEPEISAGISSDHEGPANLVDLPLSGPNMPYYQIDAPPLMPNCVTPNCNKYPCLAEPSNGGKPFDVCRRNDNLTFDESRYAVHSDFPGDDLGTGVRIRIPEHLMTIGPKNCYDNSCDRHRGVYNLYIPITHYFPYDELEIDIEVPVDKTVNDCGPVPYFYHRVCTNAYPSEQQLYSNMLSPITYQVNAGGFQQVAYRYRVGPSTSLCDFDDYPGTYEEYNLIFYRTCARSMTDGK
ncbi:unnamed protein product [Caenorhabditis bovis]|uniref:Peptidase S74 domain-containing protein n=1 Tax=Caenorhabditis bovis TaxID=2654633 RepID=A0A8S1EFD2_9PELO|nr:unnamed protein product [Caenorhabditis bovis]